MKPFKTEYWLFAFALILHFAFRTWFSETLQATDWAHVFIYNGGTRTLLECLGSVGQWYRPLSAYIETNVAHIYFAHGDRYHILIIAASSVLNALSITLIYLIGRHFASASAALAGALFYMFSVANLVGNWIELFSVFQLGPQLCALISIYAYLQYRSTGRKIWFLPFAIGAIVGPWLREIGILAALVPFCMEAFAVVLRKRRPDAMLFVSGLGLAHGLFPNALSSFLGIYPGPIRFVFSLGDAPALQQPGTLIWARFGRMIVQFPIILWLIVIGTLFHYVSGLSKLSWIEKYKVLIGGFVSQPVAFTKSVLRENRSSTFLRWTLIALLSLSFLGLFLPSFSEGVKWLGAFIFLFLALSTLKFGALLPLWFAAALYPILKFADIHEMHHVHAVAPLSLIFGLWFVSAVEWLGSAKMAIKILAGVAISIGVLDHVQGYSAAHFVKQQMNDWHQNMADWMVAHVEKDSVVFTNTASTAEVFYRSNHHIDPRWIITGEPLPHERFRAIPSVAQQIREIEKAKLEGKSVYYLLLVSENTHDSWMPPQGRYSEVHRFGYNLHYLALDPLRYLVARPPFYHYFGATVWKWSYEKWNSSLSQTRWPVRFVLFKLESVDKSALAESRQGGP
jgi:hypothetical protein